LIDLYEKNIEDHSPEDQYKISDKMKVNEEGEYYYTSSESETENN
jgi:hypothetical protein